MATVEDGALSVEVRPAQSRDAASIADLSREMGYAVSFETLEARLSEVMARADHAVFVAELEGAVAGWVHVYRFVVLESEPRAEIGGLVTAMTMRRRGLGRALITQAEEWARAHELRSVGVRTNVVRVDASLFYSRLGYTQTKTQLNFRKTL